MMPRLIWVFVCGSYLGTAWAAPESKPHASAVCLYDSKTYSEGAFVCVQKSLMQVCTAEGTRMMWKPVADKDVNDRCTAPPHHALEPRSPAHKRHFVGRRIPPAADNPAKCFVFMARQYCE